MSRTEKWDSRTARDRGKSDGGKLNVNGLKRVMRCQPLWVLAMALYSGLLLHGFQLRLHSLFWDHRNIFPAFAEYYDSLNRLGELQWWSYNENGGVPAYYLDILGHNFLTPLSIISSVGWWSVGRLGVTITDWVPFYCVYHMAFVPLIFLTGFYCFLCHIVREPSARFFGLTLAAFGPAAASGVYGLGIEQAGYAFLFVASWLHYTKLRHIGSFLTLNAAMAGLFITLNHLFLYWAVIFLPLMFIAIQCFEPNRERRPLRVVLSMKPWQGVVLVLTMLIVTLPALITFAGGADWLRSISGSRVYNYEFLRAGNPLQVLATVAPGVGFQWEPNNKDLMLFGGFAMTNHFQAPANFFQYGYLGPLCGALALIAVLGGITFRGRQLLLVLGVGVLVVMLSGFSPIFTPLLVLPSPLRAVNHYSDTAFTIGFSTLLICLAAEGYAVFLKSRGGIPSLALRLFGISVGLGLVGFIAVYGARWSQEWIFGFFLVCMTAIALVLARAARGVRGRRLSSLLLILLLVDVSTNAFWWVRTIAVPSTFKQGRLEVLASPSLEQKPAEDYSSSLLVHRTFIAAKERYGSALQALPEFALASAVRGQGSDEEPIDQALTHGVLELASEALAGDGYSGFFKSETSPIADAHIETIFRTYNSLKLRVTVNHPVLLFWKNLHQPSWFAQVNGRPQATMAAYGVFTAIQVPAGRSEVAFSFVPSSISVALIVSVLWLAIAGVLPILSYRSSLQSTGDPARWPSLVGRTDKFGGYDAS